MREIIFRGKRIDNGEFEYGYLIKGNTGRTFIISYADCSNGELERVLWIEVDPTTIGQYCGKKDTDGNKIFEGEYLGDWCCDDDDNEVIGHYGVVTFSESECKWILADENGKWNDWTIEDCALAENWHLLYSLGSTHDGDKKE